MKENQHEKNLKNHFKPIKGISITPHPLDRRSGNGFG
jgi:hypothetical protein